MADGFESRQEADWLRPPECSELSSRVQRFSSEATGPPAGFAWLGCDVIGSPVAGAGLPLGDNGSDARYAVMLMMSSGVSFSTTIRIRAMFELDPLRIPRWMSKISRAR